MNKDDTFYKKLELYVTWFPFPEQKPDKRGYYLCRINGHSVKIFSIEYYDPENGEDWPDSEGYIFKWAHLPTDPMK